MVHMALMIGAMVFPMVAYAAATKATLGDVAIQTGYMLKSMFSGLAAAPSVAIDVINNTLAGKFAATTTAMGSMPGMDMTMNMAENFIPALEAAEPGMNDFLTDVADLLPVDASDLAFWPARH